MRLRLSDLQAMTEADREKALSALVEAAKAPRKPGVPSPIERRVKAYEKQYGMTTEEMRRKLSAGEIQETSEIASWLCAAAAVRQDPV
jgi:hypothetical protein